jgi:membrane-bound lytic murein transglycosylase D
VKLSSCTLAVTVSLAFLACAPARSPSPVAGPAAEAPAPLAPPRTDTIDVTRDEVVDQAMKVFGDTVGITTPAEVAEELVDEPVWDIDVRSYETHARVEHFVNVFTGAARERIIERLERGSQYEPIIRAKFKAAGLPEDLTYIALIESGFNPDAYSRAAAVGMWQFMTPTARAEKLRVDWWVDERRDPMLSTDAAIRHLGWLYRHFGSLYLAAAAYNAGSGRVARGLSRFADELEGSDGDDRFFALAEQQYLHSETKDYVPQLIASALVAKNAARYGMEYRTLPVYAYDSVKAGPATPLAAIAQATGSTTAEITGLNLHILRGMTAPRDSQYVRVPVGRADGFARAIKALPAAELNPYTRTQTRQGETFTAAARRLGFTAKQLAWYNPTDGRRTGVLRTGTTLLVPSRAVVDAARDVPDPAREIYGAAQTSGAVHVVRAGESLSVIAQRNRTTVANLKRLNNLTSDRIRVGQRLRVR